jgi:hypothetical protein
MVLGNQQRSFNLTIFNIMVKIDKKELLGNSVDGLFLRNGIDRLDNTIGYIEGNVVSCCDICNYSKHTKGYIEFLSWIDKVYKN